MLALAAGLVLLSAAFYGLDSLAVRADPFDAAATVEVTA